MNLIHERALHGTSSFPAVPVGWNFLSCSKKLRAAADRLRVNVAGREYVAFRDPGGRAVTLDARCAHMRADLSRGEIVDGRIRCPLHGWQYAADGRCVHIPASAPIPPFACQTTFPTVEVGGSVFFCNATVAPFSFPFFEGRSADDLLAAPPFRLVGEVPWYLIGANGFDFQHFQMAHDRKLVDTPVVDCPNPYARRITATYDVTGNSIWDRLTCRLAGPRVRMTVTSWSGTNILVTAEFERTTTYGMVFIAPLPDERSDLRVIVWIDRRKSALGQTIIDPVDALARSRFIRRFLLGDAGPTQGIRYNPATLIEADRPLREYLAWLAEVSNGRPAADISLGLRETIHESQEKGTT